MLSTSADPQLNELLCTRFRRANDGGQADIFLDTASTRALNELIQSLVAGCAIMARDALDRLLQVDSGHRQRNNAGALIKVLEMSLPDGASDGFAWLERMERKWVPAASDLLGVRARDFLAPLWRETGRAIEAEEFDPGRPACHASRAYREGLDWEGMKRSVLAVSGSEKEPVLLARLAEACWRMRDRPGAIEAWFTLCFTVPLEFEKLIESSEFPDWALKNA